MGMEEVTELSWADQILSLKILDLEEAIGMGLLLCKCSREEVH